MKNFFNNLNARLRNNSDSTFWGYVELMIMLMLLICTILGAIHSFSWTHLRIAIIVIVDILLYLGLILFNIKDITSEQRTFRKLLLIQFIFILSLMV